MLVQSVDALKGLPALPLNQSPSTNDMSASMPVLNKETIAMMEYRMEDDPALDHSTRGMSFNYQH